MALPIDNFPFYEFGYLIEYNRGDSKFLPGAFFDSDQAAEKAANLAEGYNDVELYVVSMSKNKIGF